MGHFPGTESIKAHTTTLQRTVVFTVATVNVVAKVVAMVIHVVSPGAMANYQQYPKVMSDLHFKGFCLR